MSTADAHFVKHNDRLHDNHRSGTRLTNAAMFVLQMFCGRPEYVWCGYHPQKMSRNTVAMTVRRGNVRELTNFNTH